MQKINKSKRGMVQIPEGSEIYKFLFENNQKSSKWELLEDVIKQLPKSKADRASRLIINLCDELEILYPESKEKWPLIKRLIFKQILGIELLEIGYGACKKEKLSEEAFEELKKL